MDYSILHSNFSQVKKKIASLTIVVLSKLITTVKKSAMFFLYYLFLTLLTGSNYQFQFHEFGIFTNFLNQIGFNCLTLRIVQISQTIRERFVISELVAGSNENDNLVCEKEPILIIQESTLESIKEGT